MELYKEILAHILEKEKVQVFFPNLKIEAKEMVEMACYKALCEIKAIIEDTELEDDECFMRIENMVRVFGKMGSDGGVRHDFG